MTAIDATNGNVTNDTNALGPVEDKMEVTGDAEVTLHNGGTVECVGDRAWVYTEPLEVDGKPNVDADGNGIEHRIWGDPHVDENNDGENDWHFGEDGIFVIDEHTTLFCDTVTNSKQDDAGNAITVSDNLVIRSVDSVATLDVNGNGAAAMSDMTVEEFDNMLATEHPDAPIFALAEDHRFVEGRTGGDLYDGGGDLIHDVKSGDTNAVSDGVQKALDRIISNSPDVVVNTGDSKQYGPTVVTNSNELTAAGGSTSTINDSGYQADASALIDGPLADMGPAGPQTQEEVSDSASANKMTLAEIIKMQTEAENDGAGDAILIKG